MADELFMFLAHGVAENAPGYRPGARHALMIYTTGTSLDHAQRRALEFASTKGWSFVEPQRGKSVSSDMALITDGTLREAAKTALERGGSIVIYEDEMPPNA